MQSEHRGGCDDFLFLEQVDEFGQLLLSESQAMHAAVNLDVNGEMLHAIFAAFLDQVVGHFQTVEFGLQTVLEHRLVVHPIRIEHDNGHGDAGFAQVHTLVMHCNGQVIAAAVLQRLGDFVAASSIAACFDHTDGLGARFDE